MKHLKLLIAVLFISCGTQAQDFKLGNVTVAELKEKSHRLEPEATAAILYKKGVTSFDFDEKGHWIVMTDVQARVKIYTEQGYRHANIEVPYSAMNGNEQVVFKDMTTYNLVDGKIEKTKLTDDSKFTDNENAKLKIKKATLPNIKEGSVIEYHYIIKSSNITALDTWYFQYEIPVNMIEYNAYMPTYFVYNRILSPYIPITEQQDRELVTKWYSTTNSKGGAGPLASLVQSETGDVSFYEIRKTYAAQNVPSLANDAYVDNIENYRSFVKHELVSSHMPGLPEKKYISDWNSVTKSIYSGENFGSQLNSIDYYKKDLENILQGKQSSEDITLAVFDFVKNRMEWDSTYGYETKKGLEKAYADKTGNVAEINLMLLSMLKYAGLKANAILLSTRDNGHVTSISRNAFNYVIVGVEHKNKIVYLDATDKNASPGILPVRDLNGTGRMIMDKQTSEEVDLMPKTNSLKNVLVMAELKVDGTLSGQVKTQYFDYNAYVYRGHDYKLSKESFSENLRKKLGNAEVSDIEISNGDNFSLPVIESFKFESKNIGEVIDSKIYLRTMLFYTMSQNPLNGEDRAYPIDFMFPVRDKYTFTIAIPEGYIVESLPEPISLTTKDNVTAFKFNIAVNKTNQIQIIAFIDSNQASVSPEYYQTLKEFYTAIVKKQTERIVLTKKL